MAYGTTVVDGTTYQIVGIALRNSMIILIARHHGPVRPCVDQPAAIFGEDGHGICQSWATTIGSDAATADIVTIELPIRIDQITAVASPSPT